MACVVAATNFVVPRADAQARHTPTFTLAQSLSDQAQRTTLAFSGLAMFTGNMESQSFFPPGKVADYTGFQYLRDNDPDNMGHNTSFLTRVACNVIFELDDAQFAQLANLALAQADQIALYGYKRFPLMKAFRRLLDGDLPAGSAGLNLNAVKKASRELYALDGQISFDRALLYANILNSLSASQRTYLDAMKGLGWNSWPDVTEGQIRERMRGLPQGSAVAVMTYAGDLFSWYAGSVDADVYFCPERHGTYFGSFYIKDAPAIGHEGYSIDEQLTATAGSALCDSAQGYVTAAQATRISGLVDTQRDNLYASSTASIVQCRTGIATLLRSLLNAPADTSGIALEVLELSELYGNLDGENNYNYAEVFAEVYNSLSGAQRTRLGALRQTIMSGTYADGMPFDYSVCTTPFLYSAVITDVSRLHPYIRNTDYLFFEPGTDHDGDGLSDEAEAGLGTDPYAADSDGDGLSDGSEVDTYHTLPLVADSDEDGVMDGVEISLGSDPLSADSAPQLPTTSAPGVLLMLSIVAILGTRRLFISSHIPCLTRRPDVHCARSTTNKDPRAGGVVG